MSTTQEQQVQRHRYQSSSSSSHQAAAAAVSGSSTDHVDKPLDWMKNAAENKEHVKDLEKEYEMDIQKKSWDCLLYTSPSPRD